MAKRKRSGKDKERNVNRYENYRSSVDAFQDVFNLGFMAGQHSKGISNKSGNSDSRSKGFWECLSVFVSILLGFFTFSICISAMGASGIFVAIILVIIFLIVANAAADALFDVGCR